MLRTALGVIFILTMLGACAKQPTEQANGQECRVKSKPVPKYCLKLGQRCPYEDGIDGETECWWVDPNSKAVWYVDPSEYQPWNSDPEGVPR